MRQVCPCCVAHATTEATPADEMASKQSFQRTHQQTTGIYLPLHSHSRPRAPRLEYVSCPAGLLSSVGLLEFLPRTRCLSLTETVSKTTNGRAHTTTTVKRRDGPVRSADTAGTGQRRADRQRLTTTRKDSRHATPLAGLARLPTDV